MRFRIAVSISVFWIAACVVMGVIGFHAAIAEHRWFGTCSEWLADILCRDEWQAHRSVLVAAEWKVVSSTIKWAVVPPFVLLVLVIYWDGIVGMARRYVRWVKGDPGDESEQHSG